MADATSSARPATERPAVAKEVSEVLAAHAHALRSIDRMLEDFATHPHLVSDAALGEEVAYARRHATRAADCLKSVSDEYRQKAGA